MAEGSNAAAHPGEQPEATRRHRGPIAVGIGCVALGLVGLLPGVLGSPASDGTANAASPPPPAVPVAKPAKAGAAPSPIPAWIRELAARDLFVSQVAVGGATAPSTAVGLTPTAPRVRATNFVPKDPFVPQVTLPSSAPAASPAGTSGPQTSTPAPAAPARGAGGYIVVLEVIEGGGGASQKAAARDVVAAENAGLEDVAANDAVPGTTSMGRHFTVYTGPYLSAAVAQSELVRALRDGYRHAHGQRLPGVAGKGF